MTTRDHGGGLDAAIAQFGGTRADWIDLSTGINPEPYPISDAPMDAWTALPDKAAQSALETAAREFWNVPEDAAILAAPGASSLIARIPALAEPGHVNIPAPTYNEHAAAFQMAGWSVNAATDGSARVIVHPNNPTGHWYAQEPSGLKLHIIDESFCDVSPDRSMVDRMSHPNTIVLKSFGKFWGLAGLRLGFAIGDPALISRLSDMLGPWPVAGPALHIGTQALTDHNWARKTRVRLNEDASRLDALMTRKKAQCVGGISLFRLYEVADAAALQAELARQRIWTRIFPYSETYIRLGLPPTSGWSRLESVF